VLLDQSEAVLDLPFHAGAVLSVIADAGIDRRRGGVHYSGDYALYAFIWKITAVESHSALAAKEWIQRIVVGTIGVEVASSLVGILTSSVPTH
jgi:hypothetical protein